MNSARRKSNSSPPAQPTPRNELEREMLEAARMLGHLVGEALLSCYRIVKARTAMEEALVRAEHESDERARSQRPDGESAVRGDAAAARAGTTLLTVNEAAAILGIGRTSVYHLIMRGELPVLRIGRSVRLVPAELEEWIRMRSTSSKLEQQDVSLFGPKQGGRQSRKHP